MDGLLKWFLGMSPPSPIFIGQTAEALKRRAVAALACRTSPGTENSWRAFSLHDTVRKKPSHSKRKTTTTTTTTGIGINHPHKQRTRQRKADTHPTQLETRHGQLFDKNNASHVRYLVRFGQARLHPQEGARRRRHQVGAPGAFLARRQVVQAPQPAAQEVRPPSWRQGYVSCPTCLPCPLFRCC